MGSFFFSVILSHLQSKEKVYSHECRRGSRREPSPLAPGVGKNRPHLHREPERTIPIGAEGKISFTIGNFACIIGDKSLKRRVDGKGEQRGTPAEAALEVSGSGTG